jgi:hypothetical protein
MALTPTDMLKIQSAIDAYERKFPHKPSPTAVEALAWQAARRGRRWRLVKSSPTESAAVGPPAQQLSDAGKKPLPLRWIGKLFLATR